MNNLGKIRRYTNISQYELGTAVGLSQTRIWRVEHEYEMPSPKMKRMMADFLQVEVSDLFSDSEEELSIRYEKIIKKLDKATMEEVLKRWSDVLRHRLNNP